MGRKVRDTSLETRTARLKLQAARQTLLAAPGERPPSGIPQDQSRAAGHGSPAAISAKGGYSERSLEAPTTLWTPSGRQHAQELQPGSGGGPFLVEGRTPKGHGFGGRGRSLHRRIACEIISSTMPPKAARATTPSIKASMSISSLPSATSNRKLTTRKVRDWHHGLAAAPRRVRTSKFANGAKHEGRSTRTTG